MLLDTHTLLWFLNNDTKLPTLVRQRIENTEFVFVSIASIWEIAIKVNVGKLTLLSPLETIQVNIIALSIQELSITFTDVQHYVNLPLHHKDPFDRILIAQAMNHSLPIISADAAFDAYPIQRVWT
ncbi:MAG: type II toxin-antitoxin system VapC family toxin [Leptolyngbyaceae cyanobacterium SL_7_1]|nr:type II toxin-antitoxin system VapC family toxin [Leptolyngbyaceae cyanobacterium SL_7_1]